jgi:hypothetical protein
VNRVAVMPGWREEISSDAEGKTVRWDMNTGTQLGFTFAKFDPPNQPAHSRRWPGRKVTHCQNGGFSVVVEGSQVIPCKIELRNGARRAIAQL